MRKNIFIVDDNPQTLLCYKEAISGWGYRVTAFPDGASVLTGLAAGPACDLVITDYRMPEMNGLELIERLARRGSTIPAILWSVSVTPELYGEARSAGAAECLEKIAPLNELKGAIAKVIKGPRRAARSRPALAPQRECPGEP